MGTSKGTELQGDLALRHTKTKALEGGGGALRALPLLELPHVLDDVVFDYRHAAEEEVIFVRAT